MCNKSITNKRGNIGNYYNEISASYVRMRNDTEFNKNNKYVGTYKRIHSLFRTLNTM